MRSARVPDMDGIEAAACEALSLCAGAPDADKRASLIEAARGQAASAIGTAGRLVGSVSRRFDGSWATIDKFAGAIEDAACAIIAGSLAVIECEGALGSAAMSRLAETQTSTEDLLSLGEELLEGLACLERELALEDDAMREARIRAGEAAIAELVEQADAYTRT